MSEPDTMLLPVKLTDDEIKARGEELAKTCQEITALEEQKKASSDLFKSQITKKENRKNELTEIVNTKKEKRQVEIREEKDFSRNLAITFRRDTEERVFERALTKEEVDAYRQGRLSIENPVAIKSRNR